MIIHYPSYYKDFKCIASDCMGSCCSAGWQILVDKDTAKFYKTVSGDFGKRLKDNIIFSKQPEFKLNTNGRCPFLNEENLCDIYTTLGPEHLCQICRDHPRFYECFNTFIECGLGIYCEEACRIILTQTRPFEIYSEESSENHSADYDSEIYTYLNDCRSQIFEYLSSNQNTTIDDLVRNTLWFAHTLQQNINSNMLDCEEIFAVTASQKTNLAPFLKYLLTLEPNDKNWFQYIENCIKLYTKNIHKYKEFNQSNTEQNQYLKNLLYYYIYRYFLKSVYDEDVLSTFKFICINIAILRALFFCKWLENGKLELMDYVMIAKQYSEEIECSDDNISSIIASCYENMEFSTESILGLF